MALTKTPQEVFRGDPADANYQPIPADAQRLAEEMMNAVSQLDSLSALQLVTVANDADIFVVKHAFNGAREDFTYDAASSLAVDGALVVDATGMGAGRWISTRAVYSDFSEMDGDVRALAAGTVLQVQNLGVYTVVASGEDFTTTGGLALSVHELPWGGVVCQQFGPTGTADDDTTVGRFISYLNSNGTTGYLGQGVVSFSTTKSITRGGTSIVGGLGGAQRTGSTRLQSTLEWVGGADPMFNTDSTAHSFQGFGVETNGSATDFLEMNSGSQRIFMTDVYFGYGQFTRSVIRSNGNRIGYSKFHRVSSTKSAPKFIDLDGQGTANGCTPVYFTECQFANVGADNTDPWTVFHIEDEKVEAVVFDRCLFIGRAGTIVVDTTTDPLSVTIDSLVVMNCEFDNLEAASARFFKLENVLNIMMDNNIWTGDGSGNKIADLTTSNVTSFRGNYSKSIAWVFSSDDASRIRGVGANNFDWSSSEGVVENANSTFTSLTQSSAIVIDGAGFPTEEVEQIIVDVTSGSGYDFRVDTTRPQNMEPDQRFDITVRNTSGGAIAAGSFNSSSFKAAAPVAPADGYSRTYSFRFNGTHAVEVGRTSSDIPN